MDFILYTSTSTLSETILEECGTTSVLPTSHGTTYEEHSTSVSTDAHTTTHIIPASITTSKINTQLPVGTTPKDGKHKSMFKTYLFC